MLKHHVAGFSSARFTFAVMSTCAALLMAQPLAISAQATSTPGALVIVGGGGTPADVIVALGSLRVMGESSVVVFDARDARVEAAEAGAPAVASPLQQETFRATAQAVGTGPTGQTTVIITISRWTSDDERDGLAGVLADQGSNALATALNNQDETGFIRFPQVQSEYPSVRLRYAREFPGENGGRTIVLGTDRPIGWAEAILRPQRSINNQVTLIVLQVDAEGRGEGSMVLGAELAVDEATDTLSVKSVSSQPIRLASVRQ